MTLKHKLLMMFITTAIRTLNIMTMMIIIRHLKSICKYSCGILSFQNSVETSIMIDHALQHNTSLQNADRGISDLLSSGSSILKSLRDQRVTLKVCSQQVFENHNFSLLQSPASLSICASICICCLICTFFYCFEYSSYFLCFTQFGRSSYCLNF